MMPVNNSELPSARMKLISAPDPPNARLSSGVMRPSTRSKLASVGSDGSNCADSMYRLADGISAVFTTIQSGARVTISMMPRAAHATMRPGVKKRMRWAGFGATAVVGIFMIFLVYRAFGARRSCQVVLGCLHHAHLEHGVNHHHRAQRH